MSAAVFAWAAPTFAHVSVSPDEAPLGGFTTFTFQVPNEEAEATTTKLEVTFPSDNPIADASVQPVPGWTVEVTKTALEPPVTTDEGATLNERVDKITWTADDDKGIGVGEFQQFRVSVGLPDEGETLEFPTLQTYSDGEVVRWVDPTEEGGPEPEFPEPVVTLTAGGDDGHGATATTAPAPAASDDSAAGTVQTAQDDADTAKTIGIVAIIFAVVALAGVAFSLAKKRPSST